MNSPLPSLWEPARTGLPVVDTLRREVDHLFESFGGISAGGRLWPVCDASESDTEITLAFVLPGIDPAAVEVSLSGGVLTVSGERKNERDEKKGDWQIAERSFGSFSRSIAVPEGLDPARVTAAFDKGVLRVTLPKPEDAKPKAHKINVKTAA
jgi:HSP20 family protein